MKVNKTIETENGTIQFQGELGQEELDLIISVGLNYLMGQGAIPFQVMQESKIASLAPITETEQ